MDYLPQPDQLQFKIAGGQVVLVTNDGSDLTPKVVAELEDRGHEVVVLNLPFTDHVVFRNAINLKDESDQSISDALQTVESQFGKIASFIHLHPALHTERGRFTQHLDTDRSVVKTVFLLSKHLQSRLSEMAQTSRVTFLTATRLDGQLGMGRSGNISVVGGGLPGLVKCLNLEWSAVFCRAVDIAPNLPANDVAKQIAAEFHDVDAGVIEVAYDGKRQTPKAIAAAAPEGQTIETTVTNESVFLVSGGARGVTATCVIEMAKVFKCKFILLGRSNNQFELPEFAKGVTEESALKRLIMEDMKARGEKPNLQEVKKQYKQIAAKQEIDETINTILQAGGQAVYVQGDVTDLKSFKLPLVQAEKWLGKITGIIHGAGRLADKYIQDKSSQDFDNVLSVKLDGLLSLFKAVHLNDLHHLILFSSVAGFYGNVGQTDYAIANEILNKSAHLFKTNHPNTQVSSINWGAWDSGMVSGALKAQFEAAGVKLVSSQGGAALIVNELNTKYANQAQVILGDTLPAAISATDKELQTYRISRTLTEEQNPFLQHHVIQGNAVLPIVNAVGWMAQTGEQIYPDFRVSKIENVRLFKGLVFDGKQPTNFVLELKEQEKNAEQIRYEATVMSQGGKLPMYHYRTQITLQNRKVKSNLDTHQHQLSGQYATSPGAILYQDDTLFHGPHFQGITEILDCTEQQLILKCNAPGVPKADQGQFPVLSVNTFFADIQYQGMVVWVQKMRGGAKSLPQTTEVVHLHRAIPFDQTMYVHVQIKEASDFELHADCVVYDEAGQVYAESKGNVVTISKTMTW